MSIVEYTGPSNPQEIRKYLMRRTKDEIIREYLRQWREYGELEAERDALATQVDSLTGITEYTAPCVFHGNAHADCVQHSGQAPCMTQTESEWLAEIQKERDALAAHIERMRDVWQRLHLKSPSPVEVLQAYSYVMRETPATSLARLKDERIQTVQQAVKRARMEWAKEDEAELARLKAERQAEADRLDWLEQQARKSRTGISFDWVPTCEGEPAGFRFMRFHHVGMPEKTLRGAIDREIRRQAEGGDS